MDLDSDALLTACTDESADAGIVIKTVLEPLGGPGSPVKPASYEGGRFQQDRRWWGSDGDRRPVDVLVIDNEPSQANRLEAALQQRRAELGLPEIALSLTPVGALPPHLPRQISSFRFPHRNADAYLRDAKLDGAQFLSTETGKAIFAATADEPEALLRWFPQALLFGFWQSHLGKKRSQAKLARAWVSEIIGIEPAATEIRREATKGDPLNLNVDDRIDYNEGDMTDWAVLSPQENPTRPKSQNAKLKLSEIGHGQVIADPGRQSPAAVSFREVVQQATVSFAALRRVRPQAGAAEARALLASLGLVAHLAAFGRPFSLRSGAELRSTDTTWTWLGETGGEPIEPPSLEAVTRLFRDCVSRAERVGLPVGSRWTSEPLTLTPAPNLAEAIRKTWPGN
jgi:CRISPR-associated protein Csb1